MNKDEDNKKIAKYAVISVIVVLVLWALTFLLFFINKMETRGQFGDMFGASNALFSGLAFAGLIITLLLQKNELSLQREELQLTRDEMKNQRVEFEKENKTLKYQRFENLFYNMLNLQQEIVAGLRYDYQEKQTILIPQTDSYTLQDERKVDKVVTGREVFRYTFDEAEIILSEKGKLGNNLKVYGYRRFLYTKGFGAYNDTWIPTIFDHYFRHLYKIIQFVDNQGFSFEEAYKYVSLLRGTLSHYELVWIFYNALNPAFHKFQELIEKYSLLKNMREDLLTRCLELERYYTGLGLTPQDLKDVGFTAGDFEFYLTDDKKDAERYYVTAFWKEDELAKGLDCLKRWRAFVNDAAGKVIEKTYK
jgi:hypothetical protein